MILTTTQIEELCTLYSKNITQIVTCYYVKGAAARKYSHETLGFEDYLQEGRLAFVTHLCSSKVITYTDIVPFHMQIKNALYKLTIRSAPFKISSNNFKIMFAEASQLIHSIKDLDYASYNKLHHSNSICTIEDRIQMEIARNLLNRKQRAVLDKLFEGLTLGEISQELSIPERTVSRLRQKIIGIFRSNDAVPDAIREH